MSAPSPSTVVVTIEVGVDPATAFAIFTEEIGRWWRAGPINWNHNRRGGGGPDRAVGGRALD